MRSIVRNFSEFLARGSRDWEHFTAQMRAMADSPEGLPRHFRWQPRQWISCVVCALQAWNENGNFQFVKIAGRDCFFKNPPAVAQLLIEPRSISCNIGMASGRRSACILPTHSLANCLTHGEALSPLTQAEAEGRSVLQWSRACACMP